MNPSAAYTATPLVDMRAVAKIYVTASGTVPLFQDISLSATAGELLAVVGASGSGKTTLLHLLAAMDAPSAGTVVVDGNDLQRLRPAEQADFRNQTVGYVWQQHHLLPEFSAMENVAMPLLARGTAQANALRQAADLLSDVELAHRRHHRTGELSGGEQQRVALARALVTRPRLLLADEPTGNLDNQTAEVVFALLQRLHAAHGLTTVMVTHNLSLAGRCTRGLLLEGGQLRPVSTGLPSLTPTGPHES